MQGESLTVGKSMGPVGRSPAEPHRPLLNLESLRRPLELSFSSIRWSLVDPNLMMRMLRFAGCRWFCRFTLEGSAPYHCTFSRNRHNGFI